MSEIEALFRHTVENLHLAQRVFINCDAKIARRLMETKVTIRHKERTSIERHMARLQAQRPDTKQTTSLHMDVLRDLKLFERAGVRQGVRRQPEPNWADVVIELKKPGVTLQILWEEYRAVHPGGYGYSRFCELFRSFERRLSPTMRQEHVAGDKVFVDYSGKKIAIVDRRTGQIREAELFVAVLGASNFTYAEATWTQTLSDWIGAYVRMFRSFDGVPRLTREARRRSAA